MVICQPVVQWKIDVKLQRIMLLQIVISALKLPVGFCEREGSGKTALGSDIGSDIEAKW